MISSTALSSPPWSAINFLNFAIPFFDFIPACSISIACCLVAATPDIRSILLPNSIINSSRSSGPIPFSVSMASLTSTALPTAYPKGCSMLVITATIRLPAPSPISTMVLASSRESSYRGMNAPVPVFTSRTMPSAPAASFLLIMEEAISGMESTVAVTFLRA